MSSSVSSSESSAASEVQKRPYVPRKLFLSSDDEKGVATSPEELSKRNCCFPPPPLIETIAKITMAVGGLITIFGILAGCGVIPIELGVVNSVVISLTGAMALGGAGLIIRLFRHYPLPSPSNSPSSSKAA